MAEAFLNRIVGDKALGISAGTQPAADINPVVKEVMAEVGIDINGQRPKMLTIELIDQSQRIVTMGCSMEEVCPAKYPHRRLGAGRPYRSDY